MARFPVSVGSCRVSVAAALFLAATAAGRTVAAHSTGAPSTLFSDQLAKGCNKCHTDNVNTPMVVLTSSNPSIAAGQQITLTFTVTTVNGTPGRAGFNIRSSQQGTFAVGGTAAGSAGTQVVTGFNGWSEATHTAPKAGEPATFTTLWTPLAGTSGTVTFTAWGNAVNFTGDNSGDRANVTTVDVNVVCTQTAFFRDADGDGFGAPGTMMMACTAPTGYVANNTDCNDGNSAIHPGAAEVCNAVDDNCSGAADEGLTLLTFYPDADHDGYGDPGGSTKMACDLAQAGAGYVADHTDCNDGNAAIHPGATEVCNGVDDNCNGAADEGGVCPPDPGADASALDVSGGPESGPEVATEAGIDAVGEAAPEVAAEVGPEAGRDAGIDGETGGGATDAARDAPSEGDVMAGHDLSAGADVTADGPAVAMDASADDTRPLAEGPTDGGRADAGGDVGEVGKMGVNLPSSGGGGCSCRLAQPASAPASRHVAWIVTLGLFVWAGRRRRRPPG